MRDQQVLPIVLTILGGGLLLGSTVLYRPIAMFDDWQYRVFGAVNPLVALAHRLRNLMRNNRRRETCVRAIGAVAGSVLLAIAFWAKK